jgi:Lar family restriction alleviation protein
MPLTLKSCPFCQSRDLSVSTAGDDDRTFYAVTCLKCDAEGPLSTTYDGAIEAWNLRPNHSDGDGQ